MGVSLLSTPFTLPWHRALSAVRCVAASYLLYIFKFIMAPSMGAVEALDMNYDARKYTVSSVAPGMDRDLLCSASGNRPSELASPMSSMTTHPSTRPPTARTSAATNLRRSSERLPLAIPSLS